MAQYKPTVDKKAAEQMNLTVLRRLDPDVEELLATAAHVALYDFDIPNKKWARKDVEGSLFLVKRRGQPRFQFIILNKKSADNFVEDVMGNFQCEVNKPYLLYRNKNNEVVGIWFYDDAECEKISALLQKISTTFAAPTAAAIGSQANGGSSATAAPQSSQATPSGTQQQGAAAAAAPTAAAAADGAAGVGQEDSSGMGDDGFWDHKVVVPSEVALPSSTPENLAVQQQQQQPTAAAPPPSTDNALMRVFAGMRLPSQQAQQPSPAGGSSAALPFLSPTSVSLLTPPAPTPSDLPEEVSPFAAPSATAAAAAAAVSPSAPPPLPLLTPQYLKQQASTASPTPAPQLALQQRTKSSGQALLQQLQGRPSTQAPPAPTLNPTGPSAAAAASASADSVDLNEAAGRVLHTKVRTLLRSLADNDTFVEVVAEELRKAGLV